MNRLPVRVVIFAVVFVALSFLLSLARTQVSAQEENPRQAKNHSSTQQDPSPPDPPLHQQFSDNRSLYENDQVLVDASGNRITLDFENLQDLEVVTDQYANFGVSFTGATALGQGESLNYLEFPPYSGVTVLYDDPVESGRITITFDPTIALTVTRVGAYVTGNRNVTMTAYGATDNVLGSVATGGANYSSVGVPNKLLEINAAQSIKTVVFFNGGETGNTYTVDDFYFETGLACNITGVPLYKQGGTAEWADDLYGGSVEQPWYDAPGHKAVFRDWGCAVTSTAMIVSYYAELQGRDGTDPGELNEWLRSNDGYSEGLILWAKVAEFARDVKDIELHYYPGSGPDNGIVNASLCNLAPIVLYTESDPYDDYGHFVVATGVASTESWNVNDPGGYNITALASDPERSYRRYGSVETIPDYLGLAIHPPNAPQLARGNADAAVSILITDPAGRVLQYDAISGFYENHILDASFEVETLAADDGSGRSLETFVFATGAPLEGEYQILITSHTAGFYELDLLGYDSSGTSSSASTKGYSSSGNAITLDVGYSPEPGSDLELMPPDWQQMPDLYLPTIFALP